MSCAKGTSYSRFLTNLKTSADEAQIEDLQGIQVLVAVGVAACTDTKLRELFLSETDLHVMTRSERSPSTMKPELRR